MNEWTAKKTKFGALIEVQAVLEGDVPIEAFEEALKHAMYEMAIGYAGVGSARIIQIARHLDNISEINTR
jgi:hypothetical protein